MDFNAAAKDWDQRPIPAIAAEAVSSEIKKCIPLNNRMCALELGCGTGLLGMKILPFVGTVTFADSSEKMLEVVREKLEAPESTSGKTLLLSLPEDSLPENYDLIFSQLAFHHIENLDAAVKLCYGALNPGGYIGIADLDTEDGSFHGEMSTVHHGIDRKFLQGLMEEAGFKDVQTTTPHVITKPSGQEMREYPLFFMYGRK